MESQYYNVIWLFGYSIHVVHDEVKDKNFELELSWVGEGEHNGPIRAMRC